MGLFDFITKTSGNNSNSQQGDSNNGQGYQTQYQDDRLIQTPFSDVKYPLQSSDQAQGQQQSIDLQQEPVDIYNQPTANQGWNQSDQIQPDNYNQGYIQNQTQPQPESMQFPVPQENQFPQQNQQPEPNLVPQDQTNETTQQEIGQNASPSAYNNLQQSTPVQNAELPPLPDITNQQSEQNVNTQAENYLEYKPQFENNNQTPVEQSQSVTPEVQPAEVLTPSIETNENSQNINQEQPVKSEVEEVTNTVDDNLNQPQTENMAVDSTETSPRTEESEETINPAEEVLEVGTNKPENRETISENSDEKSTEDQELPPLPEPKAKDEPSTETENIETSDSSDKDEKVVEGGPSDEVDIDKEIFNDIEIAVKDEFEKDNKGELNVEEVPPVASPAESQEVQESDAKDLKVFRNIGIVGLNSENVEQVMSEKLMELVRLLSAHKLNFVLDSGKGYGENLLNKLLDHKDISIMGAYLKPFYSDYSDEPKSKVNTKNYSTAIFSNLDMKLKYLIKTADIFIMPETSGLANISLLLSLISNSYLYYGQHKPVILLGDGWKTLVDNLKSSLKLNDTESSLFVVCNSPSEVLDLLKKLDTEYSEKSRVNVNKVIDMRNESDESEYFVNNI